MFSYRDHSGALPPSNRPRYPQSEVSRRRIAMGIVHGVLSAPDRQYLKCDGRAQWMCLRGCCRLTLCRSLFTGVDLACKVVGDQLCIVRPPPSTDPWDALQGYVGWGPRRPSGELEQCTADNGGWAVSLLQHKLG